MGRVCASHSLLRSHVGYRTASSTAVDASSDPSSALRPTVGQKIDRSSARSLKKPLRQATASGHVYFRCHLVNSRASWVTPSNCSSNPTRLRVPVQLILHSLWILHLRHGPSPLPCESCPSGRPFAPDRAAAACWPPSVASGKCAELSRACARFAAIPRQNIFEAPRCWR